MATTHWAYDWAKASVADKIADSWSFENVTPALDLWVEDD